MSHRAQPKSNAKFGLMKTVMLEISDFFLAFCLLFTCLAIARVWSESAFWAPFTATHFLFASGGAALIYGSKKYFRLKKALRK